MQVTQATNAAVVEQLAIVNAQIKLLQERADDLKAQLIAQGAGTYESDTYKAVVSEVAESTTVNHKKVAEYLATKVSAQVYGNAIKRATGVKAGYFKVSLYDL